MNRPPKYLSSAANELGPSRSQAAASAHLGGSPQRAAPPEAEGAADRHARMLLEASGLSESILHTAGGPAGPSASSQSRHPSDAPAAMRPRPLPGTPAADWALSGAMWLSGPKQGPPAFAPGALATAAHGAGQVLRTLAPGDIFADLDAAALLGERGAIAGLARRGDISCGGAARLIPASDGHIAVHLPREVDWANLPAWLESETDPAWRAGEPLQAEARWNALIRTARHQGQDRLVERARLLGLAVAPAIETILPRPPIAQMSEESETAPIETGALKRGPSNRPLRLLDLSTLWAGPLAASLLADCGIEVLKIEGPDRPDGARLGPKRFFDLMHQGKSGCALDLSAPSDRSCFEALLEHADLVIESARPRGLAQLGYDAASWVSAKPGRIWTSMTGYGRADSGIAFGDDAGVAAGLGWALEENGQRAEHPTFCGDAIADPLAGMHAAALILGWLRSGRGGLLDIALRDVATCAAHISDEDLVAPREETPTGWQIHLPEGPVPVAAPRARASQGKAPALAPLSDHALRAWTDSC